jgi:hypothetical protein
MGALRGALRGALIWAHSWAHSYRSTQRRTHREADVRRTAGGDSADLQRRLAGARQGIVLTRPEQNADTGRKIRKSSEQPGKPGCRNAGSPKSPRAGNREKGDPPRLAGRLLTPTFTLRPFSRSAPLLAPPLLTPTSSHPAPADAALLTRRPSPRPFSNVIRKPLPPRPSRTVPAGVVGWGFPQSGGPASRAPENRGHPPVWP